MLGLVCVIISKLIFDVHHKQYINLPKFLNSKDGSIAHYTLLFSVYMINYMFAFTTFNDHIHQLSINMLHLLWASNT